jgi:predicted metalloprotease with PDZ domain
MTRAPIITFVAILLVSSSLSAQSSRTSATAGREVAYEISFPNAVHHEAQISATFSGLGQRPLQVRMSRSSPGRYALHEFAKNVYDLKAFDSKGHALATTQPNPHQWDVAGHDGTVRVTYTLFGDRADGTYSGIDLTHAHLSIPATFVWARGLDARPVRITFRWSNPKWRVAAQLLPTADSGDMHATFTAPTLQYFMDSPTEVSEHELHTWRFGMGGKEYTYRVSLHHLGTADEARRYVESTQKIVREAAAIFGELPAYEPGTYTFLADYLPWVNGDGMEHRNSTSLTSTGSLGARMAGALGTVSHEFFHSWNVERIRPKTLEPFNLEEANMSGALWLAEGFTNYFGPLVQRRAGLIDDAEFARGMGFAVSDVVNRPGRRFFSAVQMSEQAPFVDAAASIDPQNKQNTFISYYTWGQVIALGLDLSLRERPGGISLDDFMRAMWVTFGRQQTVDGPVRPYTLDDVRQTLGRVAHDTAFGNDFFRRFIAGHEVPDYAKLLAPAGLRLRKAAAGKAWIGGAPLRFDGGTVNVAFGPLAGSPLYAAGVERGDRLTKIDARAVTTQADIDSIAAAHKPGDTVPIEFESRGMSRRETLTVGEDPRLELVPFETTGETVTDEMRAFRSKWLGSKAQ